jgi:hypothetical protein
MGLASFSFRAAGDKLDDPDGGGRGFWGFTSKIAKEGLQIGLFDSVHGWLGNPSNGHPPLTPVQSGVFLAIQVSRC